jgi:hypothetical protein
MVTTRDHKWSQVVPVIGKDYKNPSKSFHLDRMFLESLAVVLRMVYPPDPKGRGGLLA